MSMARALIIVFAGCSSGDHAIADAAPDVLICPTMTVFLPVTVAGTSPGGSLDVFHFASAGFFTGFCLEAYVINFTPDRYDPSCAIAPWLQLGVYAPFMATGTNQASASLPGTEMSLTNNVTFEATELDLPDATPPHIIGHFVSHDPAWSFDIPVDLTSETSTNCL